LEAGSGHRVLFAHDLQASELEIDARGLHVIKASG